MEYSKFHHAIQVADLVADLSQSGSGHIPLRYPAGRRPARELVASWIA